MHDAEQAAAARRRAVVGALAAQACAFLNAVTAVTSESIAVQGVDVPTFQSFLNYALLSVVHGTRWWRRGAGSGQPFGWPPKLSCDWHTYLLLAAVDVEANYLIVRAYQYTNLTSVTLLDSASIPAAMVLSRILLRVSYNRLHLASAAVVVVGFCVLVATDALCKHSQTAAVPSPSPLLGDLLAVTAACLYATSNVLQERVLKSAPTVEVLTAFGVLGACLAGIQCAVLEGSTLATHVTWNAAFVGPLLGFACAMFLIYTTAPTALSNAGSAGFNLHMLTSDLWAAAARAAFFGGFGGACGGLGFAASLATVAAGLGLYSAAPAPTSAALPAEPGTERSTELCEDRTRQAVEVEEAAVTDTVSSP